LFIIKKSEFLSPVAHCPINIDSRIMAITKSKIENPDRYTYDEAREHIFNLMTRDSYNRFLRSEIYRESLVNAKKKVSSTKKNLPLIMN
jgi:regulator of G-protein signaling